MKVTLICLERLKNWLLLISFDVICNSVKIDETHPHNFQPFFDGNRLKRYQSLDFDFAGDCFTLR